MKHSDAVIKVGAGRGFIIEHRQELPRYNGKRYFETFRLVVTAAHCLPHLPPAISASHTHERTYAKLLGKIGSETDVLAECFFVDPVNDIAVLGPPDDQTLSAEYEAYEDLLGNGLPLEIAEAPMKGRAKVLRLNGKWAWCSITRFGSGGPIIIGTPNDDGCLTSADDERHFIQGGMSGSPIVFGGRAIGVVCLNKGSCQATLTRDLPKRFLSGK